MSALASVAVRRDPGNAAETAFERVRRQLLRLTSELGLDDDVERIVRAYRAICGRSLAFQPADRLARFSRINADGTPLQFATAAGAPARSLELFGEEGLPGMSGAERWCAGRACIAAVARLVDADAELADVARLLDELAPQNAAASSTARSGAFWIGASFAAKRSAALRIYVNGGWGEEAARWSRLDALASHFGLLDRWHEARSLLPAGMNAHGSALTVAKRRAAAGRIYLSGYGIHFDQYLALARALCGDHFAGVLGRYGERLLGDELRYPTPPAVCSFGLAAGQPLDFKLELCCHCLCESDAAAQARLLECFDAVGADAREYLGLLDVLAEGACSERDVRLHSYAGAGLKDGREYFPVYLQPSVGCSG